MTVGIVGCGIQGSGCASVLSRDDTVDRIIVLDLSQEKLDGMLKETNCVHTFWKTGKKIQLSIPYNDDSLIWTAVP